MSAPPSSPRLAYLALGSNLGDREAHIRRALSALHAPPAHELLRASSLHETAPVGPPQPDYLNAVVEVRTALTPRALLSFVKGYERRAGREDGERWGPRIIDVDILVLGEVELEEEGLCIPHRELANRTFVLEPLAELAPDLIPPGMDRPVRALLAALRASG